MAEDSVTIIKIDTGQAVQSVNDLRQNISLLKQQLGETTIGTAEYQNLLKQLKENQSALKDAMYGTANSLEQIAADAKGVSVVFDEQNRLINQENQSYNALVHALADLKMQWRATTDESERADLGKRIKQVNDRLKGLDEGVGNFSRNVGNYTNSVVDAFSKMGGGAAKVINPVKGLTTGFKALSATPVVAIMGLLANILSKVIENIKSSEENTGKLNASMSAFKVIGDAVTKILQGLGAVLGTVVGGFGRLIAAITGTSDKMKERQQIAEDELKLQKEQRETLQANAEAERDIAELRAKASDKLNYTAEERLAFLQKAGEEEKKIMERAYEDAKLTYEIQKAKNALTASSAEAKKAEAEAYAAMVRAETAYFQQVRTINAGINRERRQMATEARNAAREALEAKKAEVEAQKALLEQQAALEAKDSDERLALQVQARTKQRELDEANAKAKIKNAKTLAATLEAIEKKYNADILKMRQDHQREVEAQERLHLQNLANAYGQGSLEYLRAQMAVAKLQLDQIREAGKLQEETVEEYNARLLAAQRAYYATVRAVNDKNAQEATAELRLAQAKATQGTEAYYAGLLQLAEANARNLRRLEGESDTEFAIRQAEADQARIKAQRDLLDYMDAQEFQAQKNRVEILREGSIARLRAEVDLKQYELDTLHKLEEESDAQFRARQIAAEKAHTDAIVALWEGRVSMFGEVVGGMGDLFGTLADMYEKDTGMTEAEERKVKNLRIAAATIEMLNGVVTAIAQAQSLGPVAGPIMAGINSAAVIAAGTKNIQKIRNTTVSKSSASTTSASASTSTAVPAAVLAPTYTMDVQQVRTVTSATEEDRLNQMARDQRVYIVASDIEASQNAIRTRVRESTF